MPKQLFKGLGMGVFVFFAAGCASSSTNAGGITTRAYVADKERVDQDMQGNFGYLAGTPKPDERNKYKKSRKVYVLEFTKELGEGAVDTTTGAAPASSSSSYEAPAAQSSPEHGRVIELPKFDEEPAVTAPASGTATGSPSSYTVQKDDTLQKISKKFYNSYSQWPKIYEANKEAIKNPNRIKAGTVLQIPQ